MTTRPDDDDHRHPPEPTFADVMNGFSFDSGRAGTRRRWGRRHDEDVEPDGAAGSEPSPPFPQDPPPELDPAPAPVERAAGAASVRPYSWTRGRTRSEFYLAIETLVSTSSQGRNQLGSLPVEHRAIAELCAEQTLSVAEVAALLSQPLGVARVLLGDMAGLGVVTVHQNASNTGDVPDLALMERVLSGLRRL